MSSSEYKGQQEGTTYSPAGQVEFGGGSYFWRVDEVEADGTTIHKGNVWQFTVPSYLLIDNFESYTNDSPNRAFQTWIDGYGYSADAFFPQENPGNGTGAGVGHDIWTKDNNPFYQKTIMETVFTYDNLEPMAFYQDNFQSMPLYYNNANADTKYYSEAVRTWAEPQNLTAGGMTDLSLWFKGRPQKFVQNPDGSLALSSTSGDVPVSATNTDYFRFAYKKLDGDGSMIIKVNSLTFTANWTKCGIMIRESLEPGSTRAHMITLANGRLAFENRSATGGASASQYSAIGANPLPIWLKLERKGNDFTGYYSTDGVNWTANVKGATGGGGAGTNPQTIPMAGSVLIGLCLTSNNPGYAANLANAGYGGLTAIAQISNVTTAGTVTGDWTVADIGAATQPNPANDADDLYVALQDKSGKVAVATWADGAVQGDWTNWVIPLGEFKGVNTSAVTKMSIGVGDRNNPQQDGAGMVLIDNVRVIKP